MIQINHIANYAHQSDAFLLDWFKELLVNTPLDPSFEKYGNFVYPHKNKWRLMGNFTSYSFGFLIDGDKSDLQPFISLIQENQKSRGYRLVKLIDKVNDRLKLIYVASHEIPKSELPGGNRHVLVSRRKRLNRALEIIVNKHHDQFISRMMQAEDAARQGN